MATRPHDTSPEAWELYRAVIRRLGPEGRVRRALELSEAVRAIHLTGILARNPDWEMGDAVRHFVAKEYGVTLPKSP